MIPAVTSFTDVTSFPQSMTAWGAASGSDGVSQVRGHWLERRSAGLRRCEEGVGDRHVMDEMRRIVHKVHRFCDGLLDLGF